ncbi:hypothetical protein L195_g044434 [Trifolium pratense]|uniref:TF-B3 domain-containing protein n=1 Tax=Trifolium pratense TaxID=57577 RepID=A0A2K3MC13_TRIPR|nr:hypothetical protein L195_g044434 [Trifolium pratense]
MLDCNLQEFVQAPQYFYERFMDELKDMATFIDPVGSIFQAIVYKIYGHLYFSRWDDMLIHYNEPEGMWVNFKYRGFNSYNIITVKDLDMRIIQYPDTESYGITQEHWNQRDYTPQDDWKFTYSHYPPSRVDNYLRKVYGPAVGFTFPNLNSHVPETKAVNDGPAAEVACSTHALSECDEASRQVHWDITLTNSQAMANNMNELYLVGKWKDFCAANGVMRGSRIRMSVDPKTPSIFTAKVLAPVPCNGAS